MFNTLTTFLLINLAFSAILIADSIPKVVQIGAQKYVISFDQTSGPTSTSDFSVETHIPIDSNFIVASNPKPSSQVVRSSSQTSTATSQQNKIAQPSYSGSTTLSNSEGSNNLNSGSSGSLSINQKIYDILNSNTQEQGFKTNAATTSNFVNPPSIISSLSTAPTTTSTASTASTPVRNSGSGVTTTSGSPKIGLALTQAPVLGLANPTAVGK